MKLLRSVPVGFVILAALLAAYLVVGMALALLGNIYALFSGAHCGACFYEGARVAFGFLVGWALCAWVRDRWL